LVGQHQTISSQWGDKASYRFWYFLRVR